MFGVDPNFDLAVDAWRADYPGARDLWEGEASGLKPDITGFEYFVQQYLLQGNYPTMPAEPPEGGAFGLSYEDYVSATPESVMGSKAGKGKVPVIRMLQLDVLWPHYYFQRRGDRVRLTVFTPRTVDYESIWSDHWESMRAAHANWATMSEEEREVYRSDEECRKRGISGHELFLSRFLKGLVE